METAEKTTSLQIQKQRDLKTVFTDLVAYLKGDDGLLFKALALWSGSFLLISLFVGYFILGIKPGIEQIFLLKHEFERGDFVMLVFCSLLFPFALATLTLVVNQLMMTRDADNSLPSSALFSQLSGGFLSLLKKYIPNFIVVYVPYWATSYCLHQLLDIRPFEDGGSFDFEPFNEQLNTWVPGLLVLALFPPVFYFAFSGLFVALRNGIGASEAIVHIRKISADHMRQIWLLSFVFVFVAGVLRELIYHYTQQLYLVYYNPFWFYVTRIFVAVSEFFLAVFVQIAMVLIFGSVEARVKEQEEIASEHTELQNEKQDG